MESCDVEVRGGGAVGMTAALALARLGLSVALAVRPRPAGASAGPDVRAYALNAASVALLHSLKVWDSLPEDARTPVYDMQVQGDAAGGAIGFSAWQQGVPQLAFIVDAATLEDTLADAVRFAPHVRRIAADVPTTSSLRVLAEGGASSTREALGVHWHADDYGQTAVAARLIANRPHAGVARQWFRCPDVLALLPFDRPRSGCSYGLVWSLPTARAHDMLGLDAATFNQALNDATAGEAGTLELAGDRVGWPLQLAHAEPLSGPGWVLIGDSAHRVHPLAGQGLNMGLADVESLARVLAAREPWRALGDPLLLRRHVRAHAWPTLAMGRTTDALLHLFAQDQPWLRQLRNRGLSLVDGLPPLKRLLASQALDG
jgi:2-polyprenyl-6-methoxyphenol hydroxylase-like FAD-dependent oxidoreductase